MRGLAAVLIPALLLLGCSRRERSNPFDPGNPLTHGSPADFVALAGNADVTLRWQPLLTGGLLGYRLERRVNDDPFQLLAALLPPTSGSYNDYGLQNGVRHEYRLSYVFAAGASVPASDFAIPGRVRGWVTDLGAGALRRITPDGRRIYSSDARFDSPTGVAVDAVQRVVWVTDSYSGLVIRFNPENGDRLEIPGVDRPGAVGVDPGRHTAWVCDERAGDVVQLTLNGGPGNPPAVGPLQLPLDVAVDPQFGTLWVCDNGAKRLLQFTSAGLMSWSAAVPRPSRVAVDSVTQEAWMTSFESGLVVRVSANGTPLDSIPVQGPVGVAVDSRRGRIWVAEAVAGAILALHRDGTPELRLTGFPQVRELAVDVDTGNVWATVPGDGRVVVVSPAGTLVSQVAGMAQPYGIALDPGTSSPFELHQGTTASLRTDTRAAPSSNRSQ